MLLVASLYLDLTVLGGLGLLTFSNCCILFIAFFLLSTPIRAATGSPLPPPPRCRPTEPGDSSRGKYLLVCVIAGAVLLLSYRVFTPPAIYNDIRYHLSYPIEWLKSGSITMPPPTHFRYPWLSYFPFDRELLLIWLLMPLRSDSLEKFGQAGFVFLGGAAVYSLSRSIGMRKDASLLASLFAVAIPKFLLQGIFSSGNDILFVCLFLTSLDFPLRLTWDPPLSAFSLSRYPSSSSWGRRCRG